MPNLRCVDATNYFLEGKTVALNLIPNDCRRFSICVFPLEKAEYGIDGEFMVTDVHIDGSINLQGMDGTSVAMTGRAIKKLMESKKIVLK